MSDTDFEKKSIPPFDFEKISQKDQPKRTLYIEDFIQNAD